ncbi:PASTA domain-containing protein [Paenibacillus sp. N4]|uniref:penicillin-binding transpeptidase domain-containing protein n=1 Tax=Paenibacillus vietnamensis TaxID=2590547 RepID=UPI001CD13F63|nr:penicillin-binding transpeptidase domain-containing protein [Paenibacillus vietnamensis]MCA0753822.1 PASTA domain-containing protein [Paenibacillus vietnamensis]
MKKRMRMRTLFFGGVMTLLFLILVSRIYYVQVVQGAEWYERAKERWSANEELVAKRGTITDRNGNMLAMDTYAYNVAVDPKLIHELDIADEVIEGLSDILGMSEEAMRTHVTAKKENGEYVSQREVRNGGWQIDKQVADQIEEFRNGLEKENKVSNVGIYMYDQLKRFYPRYETASQLVGYIDKDGNAMTGVEAFFNEQLSGKNGHITYEKDGKRVQLAEGEVDYQPAEDGQDVKLTIDGDIQNYVEEALKEIVKEYAPKSATAIAADPNTMEILAMANMPEYDPNVYWKNNAGSYNHAVKSLYEPGSTFKIVTLAAAVQEGLFNPNEMYKSGSISIPGVPRAIRDIKREGWGTISFLEGLKYSSNVAFVKLGYERLGEEKFKEYISQFGFGQKTGIQLGGELSGRINLRYPLEVANATFGQGVSVTPIQQVAAVAAVANGGKLLQPQIVKEFIDPVTKTTTKVEPKVIRQVISEETSRKVGEYLEQVVSDQEIGTGKNAYIEGYRVAGKTGTAQKVVGTGYATDKFVVSFIGYAPVENPKIVVYIVVDEPNDPLVGGGKVAAPAFKQIVLKSLRKMGVAPSYKTDEAAGKAEVSVAVPNVTEMSLSQAKSELKVKGMTSEQVGNGNTVIQQIPPADSIVHPTQRVYLITEQRDKLTIPDLTGVSLRDALEITSLIGIRLIPEGQGYVVSQTEETMNNVKVLKVVLAPPEEAAVQAATAEENAGAGTADETATEGGESQNAASEGESKPEDSGGSAESAVQQQ